MSKKRKSTSRPATPAVETLRFLTHWGIKPLISEEQAQFYYGLANAEVDLACELGLVDTILAIHKFMERLYTERGIQPQPFSGPFSHSFIGIALKLGYQASLDDIGTPTSWSDLLAQKLIPVCFLPEECQVIAHWAKAEGYTTSAYLGNHVVKFGMLNIELKPAK